MRKVERCPCGEKSVPGLIPSVALCQKHFSALMYKTGEEHAEAVRMLNLCKAAKAS